MQKVSALFLLLILNIGCSVNKIIVNKNYGDLNFGDRKDLLERVISKNVTNKSFFIQKAEIKILDNEGSKKFIASIKFQFPDKYLISFRSSSGIEGVRILITNDTVLINDRINQKLYYGSNSNLYYKYGYSISLIPVILGDFVGSNIKKNISEECNKGQLEANSSVRGTKVKYIIDCGKAKATSAISVNNSNKNNIEIQYNDFYENNKLVIPRRIDLKNLVNNTIIDIHILKAEFPWTGNIDFVPGNNYEILQIK